MISRNIRNHFAKMVPHSGNRRQARHHPRMRRAPCWLPPPEAKLHEFVAAVPPQEIPLLIKDERAAKSDFQSHRRPSKPSNALLHRKAALRWKHGQLLFCKHVLHEHVQVVQLDFCSSRKVFHIDSRGARMGIGIGFAKSIPQTFLFGVRVAVFHLCQNRPPAGN